MLTALAKVVAQEDINFLLTNRLPRRLATRAVGRLSQVEHPWVCKTSIALWKLFTDLDLSDAATTEYRSLHACFTRALKPGARPTSTHAGVLASPCDAIVGECGRIDGERLYQIKGFPYTLTDLVGETTPIEPFRNGRFVTLRLTSSMYHRFHAPYDLSVSGVSYISGDTWNVNPIALRRVERLFCKNERAVISCRLRPSGHPILLVPVAAILVASIRLHFCDAERPLRSLATPGARGSAHPIACQASLSKGQEMGWFEHGSTIILFTPDRFELADGTRPGARIRAGQPLMQMPREQ